MYNIDWTNDLKAQVNSGVLKLLFGFTGFLLACIIFAIFEFMRK